MILTTLDILYIVLIIFSSIIWTLLIIILIRIFKILWPIVEIAEYYNKVKNYLWMYAQIPEIIKESIKEKFFWNNKKSEK